MDRYRNFSYDTERKNLENAIQKQFGFGTVYLRLFPFGGPMTFVNSHVIFSPNKEDISFNLKDGFYDKLHQDKIYIQMGVHMLYDADITPAEMTAILLHEIGHNFDYSNYRALYIISQFIKGMIYGGPVGSAVGVTVGEFLSSTNIKHFVASVYNMGNIAVSYLKPLNYLLNGVRKIGMGAAKIFITLGSPVLPVVMPIHMLVAPIAQLINIDVHKKEQYADSFAAAYGYGTDLITGLDKIMKDGVGTSPIFGDIGLKNGLYRFTYDLAMAEYELIYTMTGYGSTHNRLNSILSKLYKDLNSGDFNSTEKSGLMLEIKRLEEIQNGFVSLKYEDKLKITKLMRKFISSMYGNYGNVLDNGTEDNFV